MRRGGDGPEGWPQVFREKEDEDLDLFGAEWDLAFLARLNARATPVGLVVETANIRFAEESMIIREAKRDGRS